MEQITVQLNHNQTLGLHSSTAVVFKSRISLKRNQRGLNYKLKIDLLKAFIFFKIDVNLCHFRGLHGVIDVFECL